MSSSIFQWNSAIFEIVTYLEKVNFVFNNCKIIAIIIWNICSIANSV